MRMEMNPKLLKILDKYDYIVFDFDGTISALNIDWIWLKIVLSEYIYKNHNVNYVFTPIDETLLKCKKIFGANTYQELLRIIELIEWESQAIPLKNWILNYIKDKYNKKHMWLFTMNMKTTIDKFIKYNFKLNPFEYIITKDSCINIKPSKDDLEYIIQQWKVKKEKVLYIGDSPNDRLSWELAWIYTFIL